LKQQVNSRIIQILMRGRKQGIGVSVESGVQGYLQRMKAYPVFTPEQTARALDVLRSGGSIETLRALSSFSSPSPQQQASYELLFTTCPRLEMVISYGNFPLIRAWGTRYANDYPDLAPFPLEEYFQDALWKSVPASVRAYKPGQGRSFTTWVSTKLIWELEDIVRQRSHDLSSLPGQPIFNLDQQISDPGSDDALLTLADTIIDPQADTEKEALAHCSNIRLLYQLAHLTDQQEEVLTALFVRGEKVTELSAKLQRTDRATRARRDKALGRFYELGKDTVRGVFSGDVDVALAR